METQPKVKLNFLHAFGSAAGFDIRDSVAFGEDESNSIIYPVGRHIAVRSLDSSEISFIKVEEKVTAITAITITKEKTRRFLAVAEQISSESTALIAIFDMRKASYFKQMKKLAVPDMESQVFRSIAFSHDSKFVAAVGGAPDFIGVVWDWFKDSVLGSYKLSTEVTRITISPRDRLNICTSGPNHWKIWQVEEKTFKLQPLIAGLAQNQNFTDHDWLDEDTICSVTDMGEAYIQRNGEVIQYIQFLFGKTTDNIMSGGTAVATCISAYSRGFLVGSDEGTIVLWEKAELNEMHQGSLDPFDFIRTWSTGKKHPVASLAISNNEETVGIALKNNDIGYCSLSQVYLQSTPLGGEITVTMFCYGFHYGPITGLDVAVQRPLIATCSQADASVRIWNYVTQKCELAKKLYVVDKGAGDLGSDSSSRPLLSVAFHPSGYYLAVGFIDKIRIFHVLYDELRFFREINAKNVTCMKFSNGGHLLAAASQKTVYIYSSYTLELVETLKSHSSLVQDLMWNHRDLRLVSVGSDGNIFEYDTQEFNKQRELQARTAEFSSVAYLPNDVIVACGLDSQHSILQEIQATDNARLHEIGLKPRLAQLCYFQSFQGGSALITGCQSGNLQVFSEVSSVFQDQIVAHRGAVTKIRASPDGKYLFSAGEDGVIFIYHAAESGDLVSRMIHATEEGKEREELTAMIVDEQLAEIVLIKKAQLDAFRNSQEQAKQEMENIKQKQEYVNQQLDAKFRAELKQKEEKLMQELRAAELRYEELKQQKVNQEREYVTNRKNMEATHLARIEQVEGLYERKLAIEEERYRQLEHDKIEMKQFYENQIKEIQKRNDEAVENLANEFRGSLKKAQDEYESTRKTADDLKLIYEERLNQMDDEHEAEILDLRSKFEKTLEEKSAEITKLDLDNKNLRSEQKLFADEKEKMKNLDGEREREIEGLREQVSKKNAHIKTLEASKKELEETLKKKETKIYEYKFQIKDLQKTKNVLHERKAEVLKQLLPKDEEIKDLKTQIQSLNNEFDGELKEKQQLQKTIEDQEQHIKRLKTDLKAQKQATLEKEKKIRDILNDIYKRVSFSEEKKVNKDLVDLFRTYVQNEVTKLSQEDPESLDELKRHLKYMEKTISGMRESQTKVDSRVKVDIRKRTIENATLIQELNQLRSDKHELEQRAKQLQHQVKDYAHKLGQKEKEIDEVRQTTMVKQQSSANLPAVNPTPPPQHRASSARPQKQTPYTGRLYKGPSFENKFVSLQDKQRIVELQNELEERKEQIFVLKMEINQLKEMLSKLAAPEQASFSSVPRAHDLSP